MLAVLTVNASHDDDQTPDNDGELTLREAIDFVNGDFVPGSSYASLIDDNNGTEPIGVNDRIEIDVDTVTLKHSLVLTEPATIAPHNGREVSIVRDTSAPFPTDFAIALAASLSGGTSRVAVRRNG